MREGCISAAVFLLFFPAHGWLRAQDHGSITTNPYATPEDVDAGRRLFRSACAACHGLEGGGGSNGPSLTTGTFKRGGTDAGLIRTITKGVADTPMAAHPMDGQKVWQLVAFIRAVNIAKGAVQAKGDPAKGARVFTTNGCEQCHQVGSKGGFAGPELTAIGAHRTLAQLERAVLNPNAEVDPDYWSLRARTKSGEAISGIRLNEDMDTFQFRDTSGRLRTVWKKDLATFEVIRTSPMPSFQEKLQPGDVADLVAYLAGLRGGEER